MKEFIESILYFLKEHKERSVVIGLLTLQVLILIPLLVSVLSGKVDFEKMEKEALEKIHEEKVESPVESFALRPLADYWGESQKDLFLRSKRVLSQTVQVVEQKRTAPLNYMGLYRTENEVTVMIKSTSTGKSHFCKKGDKVDNFKIVDIKRDILVVSAPSGELIHLPKGSKEEVGY